MRSSRHSINRSPAPYNSAATIQGTPESLPQYGAHFGAREHDGKACGCASSDDGRQRREGRGEDRAVEEEECTQSLVLGGDADLAIGGEGRQEPPDRFWAQFTRVAFSIEDDEAADPEAVGLFGASAQVMEAACGAELVEETWRLVRLGVVHGHGKERNPCRRESGRKGAVSA